MTESEALVRKTALHFLLLQKPEGRYSLVSFDYTALVIEKTIVLGDISAVAEQTDGVLGVSAVAGGLRLAFADLAGAEQLVPEKVVTVLHEYGHILLNHAERGLAGKEAEREADLFAYEFAVPEFFVRYLTATEGRQSPAMLMRYLPAPAGMIRKRLSDVEMRPGYIPDRTDLELMKRFFSGKAYRF